jgi:chromosome segregation ATPase
VRAWRAAQSAEQAAPGEQDDDRVAEGVAKIVRPVAAHLAGIAPAIAEALQKELDGQRAASALAMEAILSDHKQVLDSQKRMLEVQAAAAAENAVELEKCESDRAHLEARVVTLAAEVQKLQVENVELGAEKYAAIEQAVTLATRLTETQSQFADLQKSSNRTTGELIEYRLKCESGILALQISENALKEKSAQCSELESKLEALRLRQARIEEYANGVAKGCEALQAATEGRLDRLIRTAESGWAVRGETIQP